MRRPTRREVAWVLIVTVAICFGVVLPATALIEHIDLIISLVGTLVLTLIGIVAGLGAASTGYFDTHRDK